MVDPVLVSKWGGKIQHSCKQGIYIYIERELTLYIYVNIYTDKVILKDVHLGRHQKYVIFASCKNDSVGQSNYVLVNSFPGLKQYNTLHSLVFRTIFTEAVSFNF